MGLDAFPACGLYVIGGEISLLMTAMRQELHWYSHSHQVDNQNILKKSLSCLTKVLDDAKTLLRIEPGILMAPFLDIIKSDTTTGPVTIMALETVHKIISYGLIDHDHQAVGTCVEAVADAVTRTKFIGTDDSGDGVVLMQILQVLRSLLLSPAGNHLSDQSVCEIMLSCFRICFETHHTELLRRTAEHCLRNMVQHLFIRLSRFADDNRVSSNMEKMYTDNVKDSRRIRTKRKKRINSQQSDENESRNLSNSTSQIQIIDSLEQNTSGEIEEKINSNLDLVEELTKELKDKYLKNIEDVPEQNSILENPLEPLEIKLSELEDLNVKESLEINNGIRKETSEVENVNSVESRNGNIEMSDGNINVSEKRKNGPEILENYVNHRGVRFISPHKLVPYGVPCIRELFRFLTSISNPVDEQNNEIMILLGLSLLQTAFEVSADSLSKFPSMLTMIEDELSKNLILLLDTDRLSIFAVVLQVSFLLFESQREHLKFQFERFIIKLTEIVDSDSKRISQDQREMALEIITRILRIPELPAELYINYDCGLYSTNLCEELMKFLSKNASSTSEDMKNIQIMSFDLMTAFIESIDSRCKNEESLWNLSRHFGSPNLPTKEEILTTKARKRLLVQGIKSFNESPRNRLSKLVEDGFLGQPEDPDPEKITELLKENPMMDKKAIGEYLSRKENEKVLDCFVKNFNFRNLRIDEALRIYLESFRLPGESALIYRLLDKFADHWYDSNNQPLASPESATPLAYAVTMLNVDQHNDNVKRQGNPMNFDQFKQNCNLVSGGADFDEKMLEEIYNSIKNEEIIMPAEQIGLVKENFLWKVLMKRGAGPESLYLKVGNNIKFVDKVLVEITWAPIMNVFCNKFNCTTERIIQQRIVDAFTKCASIFTYYNMSVNLDALIVSLYEFTGLDIEQETNEIISHLGNSRKSQFAIQTLFKIAQSHGDGMRNSWKNINECMLILYKAMLLPKCLTDGEDFVNNSGKVSLLRKSNVTERSSQSSGILSSLYSFITLDNVRVPDSTEATAKKLAIDCVANCPLMQIIESSKFFQIDSLCFFIKAIVSVNFHDEDITVFLLETLLRIIKQNICRVNCAWIIISSYIDGLLTFAIRENRHYLLERVTVCILKLEIHFLLSETNALPILSSLTPLSFLPFATKGPLSRQISYGLFELLKSAASRINNSKDWMIIFSLLECVGAGSIPAKSTSNTVLDGGNSGTCLSNEKPISPVSKVVLISPTMAEAPLLISADALVFDCELLPHDTISFVKCCESLNLLVRGVEHITSLNFEFCIKCVRIFTEAILQNPVMENDAEKSKYQQNPMLLLNVMHSLHKRAVEIFHTSIEKENSPTDLSLLWSSAWRPLLQGMARLCCDSRMIVRISAITHLQKILLGKVMKDLSAVEWAQCLEDVLFPLLTQLLEPISSNEPDDVEETRIRAAMLLSKVFLQHHKSLMNLPGILPFWLKVLDIFMGYMHADNSERLLEAIPEFLKNMLLVMSSTDVFTPSSSLWDQTWRNIHLFLPNLKEELFPVVQENSEISSLASDISPIRQKQQSSKSIVIQPEVFSESSRRNPSLLTEIPMISSISLETSSLSSSSSSILLVGQESQTKIILPRFEIPESASVTTNLGPSLELNTQVEEDQQQVTNSLS